MATSKKEPMVYASMIQNRLKQLPLFVDEKTRDRIMARIPKSTLQIVEQAKKDQWMSAEINAEINDCIVAEIGNEGAYNLSLKSFTHFLESSVVSPFFRSALNLFKIKPTTLVKLCPLFWKSIYRNFGELSVIEKGETRVQLLFTGLPPFVAGNRNHLMGFAGAIHAILNFSGVKALVILEKFSAETQEASFIASWSSGLMKNKKE